MYPYYISYSYSLILRYNNLNNINPISQNYINQQYFYKIGISLIKYQPIGGKVVVVVQVELSVNLY